MVLFLLLNSVFILMNNVVVGIVTYYAYIQTFKL